MLLSVSLSEPLILCLCLVFYAFRLSFIFGALFRKWICFRIILLFLGGIIVVFLYVRTLTLSNKISPIHVKSLISTTAMARVIFRLLSLNIEPKIPITLISQFYHYSNSLIIVFLVIYLLLALFNVVKITQSFKGALAKRW